MTVEEKNKIPLLKLFEAILPYHASVYVTALNIIQCIALGFLILEIREVLTKETLDIELAIVWVLRSIVAFTVILVVWHRYVSEFQYLSPLRWLDTLLPFLMGITESFIVFSTNPNAISFPIFVVGMISFQGIATFAYWHSYNKRNMRIIEKLYQDFYNNPQFVAYLLAFLKKFDYENFKGIRLLLLFSCIFFFTVLLWFSEASGILFYLVCITILVTRDVFYGFHVLMEKDISLRRYFQISNEGRTL